MQEIVEEIDRGQQAGSSSVADWSRVQLGSGRRAGLTGDETRLAEPKCSSPPQPPNHTSNV